jgi:hypothetical protein
MNENIASTINMMLLPDLKYWQNLEKFSQHIKRQVIIFFFTENSFVITLHPKARGGI